MFPVLSYSGQLDREIECLAKNSYYEGRHLSITGQTAILLTVNNRIKSKSFPRTPCEVIYQPKQFSWTHLVSNHTPYEKEVYTIIKISTEALWKQLDRIPDITLGATYYHATWMKVEPCWVADMKFLVEIDEHRFYKKIRSTGACIKKYTERK